MLEFGSKQWHVGLYTFRAGRVIIGVIVCVRIRVMVGMPLLVDMMPVDKEKQRLCGYSCFARCAN